MRKVILIVLGFGLLITSCEEEEIIPIVETYEEVVGFPAGGVPWMGDNTFISFIDEVSFVNGVSNVTNDADAIVTLFAYDESGENGFTIWFPITTMTEGDHALTYPATGGYGFSCLEDGSAYYPSDDSGNKITIEAYDPVVKYIGGSFDLNMEIDGGGTFLDDVTGEFGIYY